MSLDAALSDQACVRSLPFPTTILLVEDVEHASAFFVEVCASALRHTSLDGSMAIMSKATHHFALIHPTSPAKSILPEPTGATFLTFCVHDVAASLAAAEKYGSSTVCELFEAEQVEAAIVCGPGHSSLLLHSQQATWDLLASWLAANMTQSSSLTRLWSQPAALEPSVAEARLHLSPKQIPSTPEQDDNPLGFATPEQSPRAEPLSPSSPRLPFSSTLDKASTTACPPPVPIPTLRLELLSVAAGKGPEPVVPNMRTPQRVSNELFEGHFLTLIRTEPVDPFYADFFEGRRRMVEVQIQGRFKVIPEGMIYVGGEITEKMHLSLFTRGMAKAIMGIIRAILPGVHFSFGDKHNIELPCIVGPLVTSADKFVVTPAGRGQTPPRLGEVIAEAPDVKAARRAMDVSKYRYNTEDTYTFSFNTNNFDLTRWAAVQLPVIGVGDLHQFWGDAMMRFVVYSTKPSKGKQGAPEVHVQAENRYAFSVQFTHCPRADSHCPQLQDSTEGEEAFMDDDFSDAHSDLDNPYEDYEETEDESEFDLQSSSNYDFEARPGIQVEATAGVPASIQKYSLAGDGTSALPGSAHNTSLGHCDVPLVLSVKMCDRRQWGVYVKVIFFTFRGQQRMRSHRACKRLVMARTTLGKEDGIGRERDRISTDELLRRQMVRVVQEAEEADAQGLLSTLDTITQELVQAGPLDAVPLLLHPLDQSHPGTQPDDNSPVDTLGKCHWEQHCGWSGLLAIERPCPHGGTATRATPVATHLGEGVPVWEGLVARVCASHHWVEEWAVLTPVALSCLKLRGYRELSKPKLRIPLPQVLRVYHVPPTALPFLEFHFVALETLSTVHYLCCGREAAAAHNVLSLIMRTIQRHHPEQVSPRTVDVGGCAATLPKEAEGTHTFAGYFGSLEQVKLQKQALQQRAAPEWNLRRRWVLNTRSLDLDLDGGWLPSAPQEPEEGAHGTEGGHAPRLHGSVGEGPCALVVALLRQGLAIQTQINDDICGDVELHTIASFLNGTSRLRNVHLQGLNSSERKAFFVNLYHLMVVHACLLVGPPRSASKFVRFFTTMSYECAGELFSLAELEHNILRASMRPPNGVLTKFLIPHSAYDCGLRLPDHRLNFVLNCGSEAGPSGVPIYTASSSSGKDLLDAQLDAASTCYLQQLVKVSLAKRTVTIPKMCQLYTADFGGGTEVDMVQCIVAYLKGQKQADLKELLLTPNKLSIRYLPYVYQCRELDNLILDDPSLIAAVECVQ